MNKVTIVAEIGVNHNGEYSEAIQLIEEAKKAGVDAVKFQLWGKDQFLAISDLRLNEKEIEITKLHAESFGLEWFCTAFDMESLKFVDSLGVKIFKIPSNRAVVKNLDMIDAIIEKAYQKRGKLFISTGISSDAEIELISWKAICTDATFFHCVSAYPTKPSESRLLELKRLENWRIGEGYVKRRIGLSDHSGLPEIPVAAVAMGATVIEVHLTMNKNQEGPDHKASMEPETFAEMIRMIRNVEKAI